MKKLDVVAPTQNTVCLAGLDAIPETKRAELEKILDEVEIMPVGSTVASGEPFNCRTWLKMAVNKRDGARVIRLMSDVGTLKLTTSPGWFMGRRYGWKGGRIAVKSGSRWANGQINSRNKDALHPTPWKVHTAHFGIARVIDRPIAGVRRRARTRSPAPQGKSGSRHPPSVAAGWLRGKQ